MGLCGDIGLDGAIWEWRGERRVILFRMFCAEFATVSLHSVAGEYAV